MKNSIDSILNLEINYKDENKKLDEITKTKNLIQNEVQNINLKIEDNEKGFLKNQNDILQIEILVYNSKTIKQAIELKNKSLSTQKEIKDLQERINETSNKVDLIKKEEIENKNNLNKIEYQWYLDQATILAKKLEKDIPCPVCGSTIHPSPNLKSNNEDPISDNDLKLAREEYNQTISILHKLESELNSIKNLKITKLESADHMLKEARLQAAVETLLANKC